MIRAIKVLALEFSIAIIGCSAVCFAYCPVDHIILRGRVEDIPEGATVRVQLVYSNQGAGDSVELTLDGASFRVEVPFLTQSRAAFVNGIGEKCKRKPETVMVILAGRDRDSKGGIKDRESENREYDRFSLDFPGDLKKSDSTSYALQREIVLRGASLPGAIQ